jgi:hypothetical protein
MKAFALSLFATAIFALASQSSQAMDSMHSSIVMPTCANGDQVVGMNTMSKIYMTHDQMKMKMAGMSDSQMSAMMKKNRVKMVCMSKAKATGARMMH